MGGFAIVHAYGMERATADIDVLSVAPYSSTISLLDLAGKESALRRKHGLYVDVVTVATASEDYESRLTALFPGRWKQLHLLVLEPHDLALTKLERNFERDRGDVAQLGAGRPSAGVYAEGAILQRIAAARNRSRVVA